MLKELSSYGAKYTYSCFYIVIFIQNQWMHKKVQVYVDSKTSGELHLSRNIDNSGQLSNVIWLKTKTKKKAIYEQTIVTFDRTEILVVITVRWNDFYHL